MVCTFLTSIQFVFILWQSILIKYGGHIGNQNGYFFYVEMHFEVKLKPKDYFQAKSRPINSNEA